MSYIIAQDGSNNYFWMPRWRNGSRRGLKIPWSVMAVRVRLPFSVQKIL